MNREGATRIAQAAFKPISWSVDDTAPTVRQIKIHNAVGVKLGLWKYPKARKHRRPTIAKTAPLPTNNPELVQSAPKKKRWWQRK